MRLDLFDHGNCECLEYGDCIDALVDWYSEGGAFEATTPEEQLATLLTIREEVIDSGELGELRAIIRYEKPGVQARVYGGEVWPIMVVDTFGPVVRRARYRRVDNGPDDVYGVERID